MWTRKRTLRLERLEARRLMYASAALREGVLTIEADEDGGAIDAYAADGALYLIADGDWEKFPAAAIDRLVFQGSDVSDQFRNHTSIPSSLYGHGGDDVLMGGAAGDALHGGPGDDRLSGDDGDDRLYTGTGRDQMRGGTGDDTLVAIDGDASDLIFGGPGHDTFWLDKNEDLPLGPTDDVRDATGDERDHRFHAVGQFQNGADKTLDGDDLADPTDGLFYKNFSQHSLFAANGPSPRDIDQGALGDCWLLASLGAVAASNPTAIEQTIVDLGDRTYGVKLGGGYYRIDGDLPTTSSDSRTLRFARFGQEESIWVGLVEKAYAFFRHGEGTYASLHGGWSSEVFAPLGAVGVTSISFGNGHAALAHIAKELRHGKAVVVNVDKPAPEAPLVATHAYIVEAVNYGTVYFGQYPARTPVSLTLRNPWGTDGMGSDGADDGCVDVSGWQLIASIFSDGAIESARI